MKMRIMNKFKMVMNPKISFVFINIDLLRIENLKGLYMANIIYVVISIIIIILCFLWLFKPKVDLRSTLGLKSHNGIVVNTILLTNMNNISEYIEKVNISNFYNYYNSLGTQEEKDLLILIHRES